MANYYNSSSPPPLQHPVPTHPAFIPEPPSTPASPQTYQRYASSPLASQNNSQHFPHGTAYPQFPHQPPHLAPPQNHPMPPHGMSDFSVWGIDGTTAQFGMQLGQNAVAAGQSYVQRNVRLLFSSRFFSLSSPNSACSSVDSYQSLISNTTSMFQIHMSSANSVSSYFPGGIDPGRAKCAVRRLELANFSPREMILTRQTFTSLVCRLPYAIFLRRA